MEHEIQIPVLFHRNFSTNKKRCNKKRSHGRSKVIDKVYWSKETHRRRMKNASERVSEIDLEMEEMESDLWCL